MERINGKPLAVAIPGAAEDWEVHPLGYMFARTYNHEFSGNTMMSYSKRAKVHVMHRLYPMPEIGEANIALVTTPQFWAYVEAYSIQFSPEDFTNLTLVSGETVWVAALQEWMINSLRQFLQLVIDEKNHSQTVLSGPYLAPFKLVRKRS